MSSVALHRLSIQQQTYLATLLIHFVMRSFDNLIDELVSEVRKYFEYPPYNRAPFDDDFPQKMKVLIYYFYTYYLIKLVEF